MKLAEYQITFIKKMCASTAPENAALQIYHNAGRIIRVKALQQVFPLCEKIVGPDYFAQLAGVFIEKNSSSHNAVNQQGELFSAFIATQPVQQQVPYLSDLAQLEWLWHETLHDHSNAVHEIEKNLKSNDPLRLMPYARLLTSNYPLIEIWHMCQDDYHGDFTLQGAKKSTVLIVQINDEMRLLPLSPIEHNVVTVLTHTISCVNLQNKYKTVYNENLDLAVLERLVIRKALLKIENT